ncbi:Fry-C domain-containing protein [Aphelenchoides bicaudatus]|nr:Fry-C domain-containing protein [Aphelenchoides bicaudatus]
MLELFNNIVNSVQNTPNSQEFAISPAVNRLHHDLLSCVNELPLQPDSRLSTTSLNIPGNEQLSDILTLHSDQQTIQKRTHYFAPIKIFFRSQFGSEFGCCDDTNVDALLIHYCQSHKLKTWTLIGSVDILQTGCAQLREKTCMFGSMIRTLMADSEGTVRSSRVSSVNESMYNSATHTS